MNEKTQQQEAREFAHAFRVEHPDLIREIIIDMDEGENLQYYEVPVLEDGNVDVQRPLGTGGRARVTTGNILVYQHGDWQDYTPIWPHSAVGGSGNFTAEELRASELFANWGPIDGSLVDE